jgi:hypothetical protein
MPIPSPRHGAPAGRPARPALRRLLRDQPGRLPAAGAGDAARGETGSIVTLLCDRGERYAQTLFDDDWLAAHGIDPVRSQAQLSSRLLAT